MVVPEDVDRDVLEKCRFFVDDTKMGIRRILHITCLDTQCSFIVGSARITWRRVWGFGRSLKVSASREHRFKGPPKVLSSRGRRFEGPSVQTIYTYWRYESCGMVHSILIICLVEGFQISDNILLSGSKVKRSFECSLHPNRDVFSCGKYTFCRPLENYAECWPVLKQQI